MVHTAVMTTGLQPVDFTSDRPVYKQIADRLREQMEIGALTAGQKLPSESELIGQSGASRATVRRALDVLIHEGRVRAERGIGVFVRDTSGDVLYFRYPEYRFRRVHRETDKAPLERDAESQGFGFQQRILALEEVPAPAEIADLLGLDNGEIVFVRRRLIHLGPSSSPVEQYPPAQLADSYLPLDIAVGRIREADTGPGGTYARIEDDGHMLTHFDESLSVRMPSPYEARLLQLDAGIPVVDLTRVAYAGGRPVECFVSVLAGDRFAFEYRIPAA